MVTYSQEKVYNGNRKWKPFMLKFETGIEKLPAWNLMNLHTEFTVCILYRPQIVFKISPSLYFTIIMLELSCKNKEKKNIKAENDRLVSQS